MKSDSIIRRLFVILTLSLSSLFVLGQTVISVNSGIGTFGMSDLKRLQDEFRLSFPVEVAEVQAFPPFLVTELNVSSFIQEDYSIGGTLGFKSSGSRLHYSDFSGSTGLDMTVRSITLGLIGNMYLIRTEKIDFSVFGNAGVDFTSLEIESFIELSGVGDEEAIKFRANNIFLEFGVSNSYKWKKWMLNGSLGYELTIPGKLNWTQDSNAFLTFANGSEAHATWNGIRFTLGLGYVIE